MTSTETVTAALAILAAVLAAGALTRLLGSRIPLPLVQIALGLAIGFGTDLRILIDADAFLLLFLPPLLFLDAWRLPKHALRRDGHLMAELAIGLVFMTVLGLGLFLHWLLPTLPLALCFALAAVLSPTDAVAVAAIARRMPMPSRMLHLLEGEALLNDASALVCLKFAIAALATGYFRWWEAGPQFVWMAGVGLAIGAALAWAAGNIAAWVARRFGEDPGAHILLTLLLPFGAYLLSEWAEASGILAAVAAGLMMGRVDRRTERPDSTVHRRKATWDMVSFALNGAVFVLLGEQFSMILPMGERSAMAAGIDSAAMLALHCVAITLALLLMRAAWTYGSMRLDHRMRPAHYRFHRPPLALIAASALAGVRGSVTLVAALTIPFTNADGSIQPLASTVLTVATSVIILSLLIASIGLPIAIRRLPPELLEPVKGKE